MQNSTCAFPHSYIICLSQIVRRSNGTSRSTYSLLWHRFYYFCVSYWWTSYSSRYNRCYGIWTSKTTTDDWFIEFVSVSSKAHGIKSFSGKKTSLKLRASLNIMQTRTFWTSRLSRNKCWSSLCQKMWCIWIKSNRTRSKTDSPYQQNDYEMQAVWNCCGTKQEKRVLISLTTIARFWIQWYLWSKSL